MSVFFYKAISMGKILIILGILLEMMIFSVPLYAGEKITAYFSDFKKIDELIAQYEKTTIKEFINYIGQYSDKHGNDPVKKINGTISHAIDGKIVGTFPGKVFQEAHLFAGAIILIGDHNIDELKVSTNRMLYLGTYHVPFIFLQNRDSSEIIVRKGSSYSTLLPEIINNKKLCQINSLPITLYKISVKKIDHLEVIYVYECDGGVRHFISFFTNPKSRMRFPLPDEGKSEQTTSTLLFDSDKRLILKSAKSWSQFKAMTLLFLKDTSVKKQCAEKFINGFLQDPDRINYAPEKLWIEDRGGINLYVINLQVNFLLGHTTFEISCYGK